MTFDHFEFQINQFELVAITLSKNHPSHHPDEIQTGIEIFHFELMSRFQTCFRVNFLILNLSNFDILTLQLCWLWETSRIVCRIVLLRQKKIRKICINFTLFWGLSKFQPWQRITLHPRSKISMRYLQQFTIIYFVHCLTMLDVRL